MKRKLEQIYVMFMLLRIAHHNKIREKFEEKYEDVFISSGEALEHMRLVECYEKDDKLYAAANKEHAVAAKPQRDDFGLYEYVYQVNSFEDCYYGTIYTKTPFKNKWLSRGFEC